MPQLYFQPRQIVLRLVGLVIVAAATSGACSRQSAEPPAIKPAPADILQQPAPPVINKSPK